jgi:hypothetical protein
MRRTSARLAQLRQHLHRVKWRDEQALAAYSTLLLAQPPTKYVLANFDAVLKEYYTDDFAKTVAYETNAFMSFIQKKHSNTMFVVADENVPPDRAYVVPWEYWLPEPKRVEWQREYMGDWQPLDKTEK